MKYWKEILGVILIVSGFFMALNEDASLLVNIIGWVILAAAVGGWVYAWRTQERQK
jgi:drug/metabolite transporter (DMT)-like permease